MRMLTALLALQLQGALASRLVAHQARRTDAAEIRFDGWSPEPTPSPKIAHDEILRRSYDSLLPNPTCGYIDNLLGKSCLLIFAICSTQYATQSTLRSQLYHCTMNVIMLDYTLLIPSKQNLP